MKSLVIGLLVAVGLVAQTPSTIYGGGISYSSEGSPSIMGEVVMAVQTSMSPGTYMYNTVDFTKFSFKPLGVVTSPEVGIAQQVKQLGKVTIFTTLQAGASVTGSGSVGGAFSGGYLMTTKIKGNWYAGFFGKALKSTVAGGPVGVMAGLNIFWGK